MNAHIIVPEMRVEHWDGYDIRFIKEDGEWWAVLKDICVALDLQVAAVNRRLPKNHLTKISVPVSEVTSSHVRSRGENKARMMSIINEQGIYATIMGSRKPKAKEFQNWVYKTLATLREKVGLQQYEAMRMTDEDTQARVDDILDSIFYDEKTGALMITKTVQGGDVEVVPYETYECE